MTVLHYLEETARLNHNKTAISDEKGQYTFSELHKIALSLANCIQDKLDGKRHQPLLVYLPKGKECIAVFMGIVYSGNIYTPTDIKFPFPKVQGIIDVLNPVLYISDRENAQNLCDNGIPRERILIYEDIKPADFNVHKTLSKTLADDPVYVLFTSGSTGIPKGVTITHRGICDYIDWATETFAIVSSTIIGNQAPFYFDNSTLDIYLCIKTGAELRIIPEQYFAFPVKLMQTIAENNINFIFWVPSALIAVANHGILNLVDCSCLKKILFAGEVMPNKQLNYWRNHITDAMYANLYGPTEITVDCTFYIVDRPFLDDEPLPIGVPCSNTGILLLDKDDTLITTANVKGEICVRGSCLALGYWNAPEITEKYFCQNPLNPHFPEKIYRTGDLAHYNDRGEIMFDGRKDSQIKHMGYRIELGEIETIASGVDAIEMAIADYDALNKEILLFFSGSIEVKMLRMILLNLLPKYMVPSQYIRVDEFPYNDNGKIDHKSLKSKYMEM